MIAIFSDWLPNSFISKLCYWHEQYQLVHTHLIITIISGKLETHDTKSKATDRIHRDRGIGNARSAVRPSLNADCHHIHLISVVYWRLPSAFTNNIHPGLSVVVRDGVILWEHTCDTWHPYYVRTQPPNHPPMVLFTYVRALNGGDMGITVILVTVK